MCAREWFFCVCVCVCLSLSLSSLSLSLAVCVTRYGHSDILMQAMAIGEPFNDKVIVSDLAKGKQMKIGRFHGALQSSIAFLSAHVGARAHTLNARTPCECSQGRTLKPCTHPRPPKQQWATRPPAFSRWHHLFSVLPTRRARSPTSTSTATPRNSPTAIFVPRVARSADSARPTFVLLTNTRTPSILVLHTRPRTCREAETDRDRQTDKRQEERKRKEREREKERVGGEREG